MVNRSSAIATTRITSDTCSNPDVSPASADSTVSVYDLAIVGGGIVGLTLACSLKASGLKIALIESQSRSVALQKRRAYAITLMSGRIFDGLGLWKQMVSKSTTFNTIRLADADCGAVVNLQPQDLGTPELGYVAEHHVLAEALYHGLDDTPEVTCYCPANVTEATYHDDWVDLTVMEEGQCRKIRSQLLVAADGSRSSIRQQANIDTFGWPYWQSCVTAVIQPEKSHRNIAHEHFWPSGPFATLPLTENRCQIVLTAPHDDAKQILDMDEEEFLSELDRRYDHQLGTLKLVGDRALFPVKLMHSCNYVLPRLALVGDAAHSCHPVGGQGMNLGIRDAAALAQVLLTAHRKGKDLGNLRVLKQYERWRKFENWIILGFTDLLDRSFSNTNVIVMPLRRLGLRVMTHLRFLKHLSLGLMTGMIGRRPIIAKTFSDISPKSSGLSV